MRNFPSLTSPHLRKYLYMCVYIYIKKKKSNDRCVQEKKFDFSLLLKIEIFTKSLSTLYSR